jgi:F-box protein 9
MSLSISSDADESDELKRFREEWRAEVRKKKIVQTNQSDSNPPSGPSTSPIDTLVEATRNFKFSVSSKPVAPELRVSTHAPIDFSLPKKLEDALRVYTQAVLLEQQGDLDTAVTLYRQAFRLDANVDKIYHRQEMVRIIKTEHEAKHDLQPSSEPLNPLLGLSDSNVVKHASEAVPLLPVPKPPAAAPQVTGTLRRLIAAFPLNLQFEAEEEAEATPLDTIPDELVVRILRNLDPTSIERFASMSRKARIISLDASLWRFVVVIKIFFLLSDWLLCTARDLVCAIYKPPQIQAEDALSALIDKYLWDYRRLYIEQPRVRLDGVYIAVCHYM